MGTPDCSGCKWYQPGFDQCTSFKTATWSAHFNRSHEGANCGPAARYFEPKSAPSESGEAPTPR